MAVLLVVVHWASAGTQAVDAIEPTTPTAEGWPVMNPRRDWIANPPAASPARPSRRRPQRRQPPDPAPRDRRRFPVAIVALGVLLVVGLSVLGWLDRTPGESVATASSTAAPTVATASTAASSPAAPGTGTPTSILDAAPPEPDSSLPEDSTSSTTAAQISAAAVAFVAAYARPAASVDEPSWWARVEPTLTADAAELVRGTDPTRVTWSQVTGLPQLVPPPEHAADYLVRDVDVPTDAGTLRVTVNLDQLRVEKWRTAP